MKTMGTLTVADICNNLNVVPNTVKRWIAKGKLKATIENNRVGYRITYADYADFLEKHPMYKQNNKDLIELGAKVKICENLLIGMYRLQNKFLLEEHGRSYSEGWNDAMDAFDRLVKENIVDPISGIA